MTAPNQPYPAWMQLLGLGAFQVGGTGGGDGSTASANYGQDVTQSHVMSLIQGPGADLATLAGTFTEVSDLNTLMSTFLKSIPLQGLQVLQGFIPGATSDGFGDIDSAITSIIDALGLENLGMTLQNFNTWLTDTYNNFAADGTAFWAFINAVNTALTGYTDWTTFITAVDAAWDTYQDAVSAIDAANKVSFSTMLLSVFGIDVSGPNAWLTRLMQDTQILFDVFHLTYTSTQWNNAWTDLLSLLGLATGSTPTSSAPTIGPAITSAQSSATTANTNAGTAQTTANTGLSWGQRLTNDVTTLLDVFHLTYTLTQWNAAWADLLSLFGIVNSVSTPSNPTPTIGPAITSAQSTANTGVTNASTALASAGTANTNATTAQSWGTRLTNDLMILLDVFHLTHTATVWNAAWADLMSLFGVVNSTIPATDPTPTIGPVIQANTASATTAGTNASIAIASNQATNDAIVSATTGAPVTGSSTTDITTGLSNIPATNIVGGAGAAVTFGAVGAGNNTNLSSATSGSISWSHTIATGDLCVLVMTCYSVAAGGTGYTSTATYGGTAMTLLQRQASSVSGGAAFDVTEAWVLKAPASGSKTVVVSVSATSANFNTFSANSVSYSASKIGTVGPNTGGGSSTLSMSASSATGKMVVGAFGVSGNFSGLPTLTAYNQTSRYNARGLVMGDAAGAGSVAFTATASGTATNVQWAGITVELTN